tara:strand:- start:1101 stop:1205 length:105 start_codon:yes stop_codon:yes gene_type:complete
LQEDVKCLQNNEYEIIAEEIEKILLVFGQKAGYT